MITYPTVGNGVQWTPVAGGAAAETSFTFTVPSGSVGAGASAATLPVRVTTSNEVTKAGISRTVIKLEANLDASLFTSVRAHGGAAPALYSKTLIPVNMHLVVAAPRGAAQMDGGDGSVGLGGLLAFMLGNLLTILTGRSSDKTVTSGTAWPSDKLLDGARGLQLFDPISGVYGAAS